MAVSGCHTLKNNSTFCDENIDFACQQISLLLADAEAANMIPRTIKTNGELHWINDSFDWTEGFFPGTCWYLYEYSKDESWQKAADNFQKNTTQPYINVCMVVVMKL